MNKIDSGYRCGANVMLDSDKSWEREIYQAD